MDTLEYWHEQSMIVGVFKWTIEVYDSNLDKIIVQSIYLVHRV